MIKALTPAQMIAALAKSWYGKDMYIPKPGYIWYSVWSGKDLSFQGMFEEFRSILENDIDKGE